MQYENVFKGDRWCSCYTCLPQSSPAAQTTLKMAPGTSSDGSTSTHDHNAKNKSSTYTYMQARANTKKQYNNT